MSARPKDWSATSFHDRVDPGDPNFRLVELRLPHDAEGNPGYGPFAYVGIHACERLRRFCAVFLQGMGDLTEREAEKILRKSHVVDDKVRTARGPSPSS